jgi:hypothetical protein
VCEERDTIRRNLLESIEQMRLEMDDGRSKDVHDGDGREIAIANDLN